MRGLEMGEAGPPAPLGQTTAAILAWFAEHGPATAVEIGRVLGIDGRSMRGRLSMLVQQGLVESFPSGAKPLRPTYSITAEGRQRAGIGDERK